MKTDYQIVVLLHGIGHPLGNMVRLESALLAEGYKTLNISYPSLKYDLRTLADWLAKKINSEKVWQNYGRVHFITLSMGGLLACHYLEHYRPIVPKEKMGRVVMLGPPHGGSEVADLLHKNPLYKWLLGPAGQELTTYVRKSNRIQPWYELGIIAGSHNWAYPFGLFCIKESNDGCVSITSSKLDGMKDHIVLPVLHGFMGWKPAVHRQVAHFLKEGEFNHET